MKKSLLLFVFYFLLISCHKEITENDIAKINGYWEIEKVVFPDGNEKKYTINETYDYFEIKNNSGFRKKVNPQLDGTFLVNDTYEKVTINKEKENYFLNYSTSFSKWKEKIITLTDSELVLINTNNEYHYKRATPINIIPNGKKTQ